MTAHLTLCPSVPPLSAPPARRARILVVDDAVDCRLYVGRMLALAGHDVETACDAEQALARIEQGRFELVITDVCMPGPAGGIELLRTLQANDPDLPVILMTAHGLAALDPAFEHGAVHCLLKPLHRADLTRVVNRCLEQAETRASMRRSAARLRSMEDQQAEDHAQLDRALARMAMVYQPIVDRRGTVVGHEALMRNDVPGLSNPLVLLDTAARLRRVGEIARRTGTLAPRPFESGSGGLLFFNVLTSDLENDQLLSDDAPLARIADRVVLEITEGSPIAADAGFTARLRALRQRGFRIALDDLGAGYSALSTLAAVEPDVVKLDRSLIADIHRMPRKERLVRAMTTLCREEGALVLAEGVEVPEERDLLREIGCDLFQGFHFGRPAPTLARMAS